MFSTKYSEIDKKTKLKVLISWKGRVVMEKEKAYREDEELNKIYSTFCNVVHNNNTNISIFKLRLMLIKVMNIKKPLTERLRNWITQIFSSKLSIPKEDSVKILLSWCLRTKLERNKKYFYNRGIKSVYEHLSNVLHGELEKHSLDYIKSCEEKIEKFFIKIREFPFYQLKGRQTVLDLKNVNKFKKKKILKANKAKGAKIFFYKTPSKEVRIAFIESEPSKISELINKDKIIILKHNTTDKGVFEYVDSSDYESFIKSKNHKKKNYYQLYY